MTDNLKVAPSKDDAVASRTPSVWEARYRAILREWDEELEKRKAEFDRQMELHLESVERKKANNGVGRVHPKPKEMQNIPPGNVMRARVELDKLNEQAVETPVEKLLARIDALERENKQLRGKIQRGSIR